MLVVSLNTEYSFYDYYISKQLSNLTEIKNKWKYITFLLLLGLTYK